MTDLDERLEELVAGVPIQMSFVRQRVIAQALLRARKALRETQNLATNAWLDKYTVRQSFQDIVRRDKQALADTELEEALR